MPKAFLLKFRPAGRREFDVSLGEQAHALFLSLVARLDADVAQDLHDSTDKKPFTLSPVLSADLSPVRRIVPQSSYFIRAAVLDDALAARMDTFFLHHGLRGLHLSGTDIAVEAVLGSDRHRLCGSERYLDIWNRPLCDTFQLRFLTPTALRVAGRNYLLPDPGRLWYGYMRRWNASAPPELAIGAAAVEAIDGRGALVISRLEIHSEVARFSRSMQLGFQGLVSFRARAEEEGMQRALCALGRFAFYAGSGYKTTMGMGLTEFNDG